MKFHIAKHIGPMPQGFQAVRILLGCLFLSAASLKIFGLRVETVAPDSVWSSVYLQMAAIELEIILGLWLLSGRAPRAAWAAALAAFTILAGVSLHLALTGQPSCSCFGRVTVHPWVTFAVDLCALAALALWRPARSADSAPAAGAPAGLLRTGAGAAAFLAVVGCAFLLAVDQPASALARLRGESITIEPAVSSVGEGRAGDERVFAVKITNHTDRPIRLVGGTTRCACIATQDLPVTLEPRVTQSVNVWLRFHGAPGSFQHRFEFFTDDEVQPRVAARFAGRVVGPHP
jgi:hypothetical protein